LEKFLKIAELVNLILSSIRNQFYPDNPREFKRDERALLKAIASYGYECYYRGWEFGPSFIFRELMDLLNQIKRTGSDIHYLPLYRRIRKSNG
jgi:spore cortex formation protein SpoVR/YcgB (stage V sporulation)